MARQEGNSHGKIGRTRDLSTEHLRSGRRLDQKLFDRIDGILASYEDYKICAGLVASPEVLPPPPAPPG